MTHPLDADTVLVGISWREGIYLDLTVTASPGPGPASEGAETAPPLAFALVSGERRFPLTAVPGGAGSVTIPINVATFHARQGIPDGEWAIVPVFEGSDGRATRVDLPLVDRLADAGRVFMHDGDSAADTVTFALAGDETRPEIRLRAFAFGREAGTSRAARARTRLRRAAVGALKSTLAVVYACARATRRRRGTRILFATEQQTRIGGNLAAIRARMLERGLGDRFEIADHAWVARNRDIAGRFAQAARVARADYLVIDDYFPGLDLLRTHPSTRIIQAWHAGVGFKAVGYARFGSAGSAPRETSHRKYTWAIAGSTHLRRTYADVFGIEREAIIPTGLPRIDAFLDAGGRAAALAAFAQAHPEVDGRRLVLFAPTYRGRGSGDAHYDFDRIDFAALHAWCAEADAVIGFRMHHFVADPVPIPVELTDRLIDLTHYPDGLGLLHSADVLITDYSSIIYEFSLLDRPMLFYAYDRDAYAATRGFQQDYDATAPGKVCLDGAALLGALRDGDFEHEKVTRFRERNFDRIDTGSSDRFIDWFFLEEMPEEYR